MAEINEKWVSGAEFAKLVGVSKTHITMLCKERRLRHMRIGAAIRVPLSEIGRLTVELAETDPPRAA